MSDSDFDKQLRENAGILTYHDTGRKVVVLAVHGVPPEYHGLVGTVHSNFWDDNWGVPGVRIDFDNGFKGKLLTFQVEFLDELQAGIDPDE